MILVVFNLISQNKMIMTCVGRNRGRDRNRSRSPPRRSRSRSRSRSPPRGSRSRSRSRSPKRRSPKRPSPKRRSLKRRSRSRDESYDDDLDEERDLDVCHFYPAGSTVLICGPVPQFIHYATATIVDSEPDNKRVGLGEKIGWYLIKKITVQLYLFMCTVYGSVVK